jgi:hypothetical protein
MQDDVLGNSSNAEAGGGLGSILSAGLFEVNRITSVALVSGTPATITLQNPLTVDFHTCTNCRVQVITYPLLGNPDYTTTDVLEPVAWNGQIGGVLAFEVEGRLVLQHSILANGKGFRGGAVSSNWGGPSCETSVYMSSSTNYGAKGESIYGAPSSTISYARSKMLNGGGGGGSHNGGGGGGGNYTAGGNGGRGWSSDGCLPGVFGFGGIALSGYISPNRIFLGGGGGGGQQNNSVGSAGANGGGIIMIKAPEIHAATNVSILANGNVSANTGNDAAGGSGAGGSILLQVDTFTNANDATLTVGANGGNGGSTLNGGTHAGGGGGGQGTVIYSGPVPGGFVSTSTLPGYGGCNLSNCSTRAADGEGPNHIGILSGFPTLLDISWISIDIFAMGDNSLSLTWSLSVDNQAAGYEVQASTNVTTWETISVVASQDEQPGVVNYSVKIKPKSYLNTSYYRIVRSDLAGQQSISPVAAHTPSEHTALVQPPFPNPSAGTLTVVPNVEGVAINLLDEQGRLIEHHEASNYFIFNLQSLASGVYFVECIAEANRELYRIILE